MFELQLEIPVRTRKRCLILRNKYLARNLYLIDLFMNFVWIFTTRNVCLWHNSKQHHVVRVASTPHNLCIVCENNSSTANRRVIQGKRIRLSSRVFELLFFIDDYELRLTRRTKKETKNEITQKIIIYLQIESTTIRPTSNKLQIQQRK